MTPERKAELRRLIGFALEGSVVATEGKELLDALDEAETRMSDKDRTLEREAKGWSEQVRDLRARVAELEKELTDVRAALEADTFSQPSSAPFGEPVPTATTVQVARDRMYWRKRWSEENEALGKRVAELEAALLACVESYEECEAALVRIWGKEDPATTYAENHGRMKLSHTEGRSVLAKGKT